MKKSRDGGGGPPLAAISDPRFAKVHTDPRFQRMPKNKTKVSIDKRFSHMFSDKSFSDPLGADKRGKATKKKEKHMLQRYYKAGEGEDEAEEKADGGEGTDEETELKPVLNRKDEVKQAVKSARGQLLTQKANSREVDRPVLKPVVAVNSGSEETSDEEDASKSEINLNSDESEDEVERHADRKIKVISKSGAGQEGDSEKEEEEQEENASSDNDAGSLSSSSSSSSESEVESDLEDETGGEDKVPTGRGVETKRFAMMNMDWEQIKAVDLFMLMRSFLPKGGSVESVTIYPTEFGMEQMKTEEVHGPKMVFENDDDEEEEDKEIDMEKLRAYEKNKLKYYYAVVECDSKETANHLYAQCDGMEFERTSNTLDLRFIPDDLKFVREPRDVAKEVSSEYKPPEFETRALQHSNVKLTWDDDEPTRVKALRKKFNADELNEMDFRAYLASESSEEEDVDDEDERPSSPEKGNASEDVDSEGVKSKNSRDKYRSLLLGNSTDEVVLPGKKKGKGDVDMEVTFHTGLSELSEKLQRKQEAKKRGDETVWEAYLRRKKEKKAQRKRSKNAKSSDDDYSDEELANPRTGQEVADPFFTPDDNGFDDPFFADDGEMPEEPKAMQKKGGKPQQSKDAERLKKREEKELQNKEEERSKAELELLFMDDEGVQGAARGFNLKTKKDKRKKDKNKKQKRGKGENEDDSEVEDKLATADLDDPRFASLFTSHHYAIDTTNPQFRKSGAQLKILAEVQRRRVQKSANSGDSMRASLATEDSNAESGDRNATVQASDSLNQKRRAELSSLVRSLKRKTGTPGVDVKMKR